jgi:hypothetical protein
MFRPGTQAERDRAAILGVSNVVSNRDAPEPGHEITDAEALDAIRRVVGKWKDPTTHLYDI